MIGREPPRSMVGAGCRRPWLVIAVVLAVATVGCGDDDDSDPTATPGTLDANTTTIEQGTVANLGDYRIGLVSVDAADKSAFVSISRYSTGEKVIDTRLTIGAPFDLPGARLYLLETRDRGSNRDTVRIRLESTD